MEIIRDSEKTPHFVSWDEESLAGKCVQYFTIPEEAIRYYETIENKEGSNHKLFVNNKQVIGLKDISTGTEVLDTGNRTWEEYKGEIVTSKLGL
ncbi:hypothetical protein [Paraclostridium bifermentans]|uniref:hypothetical protein n=1 Tax=Paraclostridium bifermentans TaxID=1490 RepID=UPI00374E292B